MKINNKLTILITIVLSFVYISCSDSDNKGGAKGTDNQSINDWIYKEMGTFYFWNHEIPSVSHLNFNDEPNVFFFKILYNYKLIDGDRFSYIEKDGVRDFTASTKALGSATTNDIGFEFQVFVPRKKPEPTDKVELCITYIKKGSAVDKADILKRGNGIVAIDGTNLNYGNCLGLIYSGKPKLKLKLINGEVHEIEATTSLFENPIHTQKTLDIGGKKIGYILYNSFVNGRDEKSKEYAVEMNNILKKFKNENIDELILDLRYNGGGYVESGTFIASAIVPKRGSENKIYTRRKYNNDLEKNPTYYNNKENPFVDVITTTSEAIPRLEMKRLHVITSQNTASASEQIINGLSVLTEVVVIGGTTVGKNMESFAIKDDANKDNKWILHPLTSMSFNSKDFFEYDKGFNPTYGGQKDEFDEFRENNTLAPLGDQNEALLALAIENITGVKARRITPFAKESTMKSAYSSIERKGQHMISQSVE